MNIDLAKKVYAHITTHPDQFDMDTFVDTSGSSECGTTACIAGWAMVLSGEFKIVVEPIPGLKGEPLKHNDGTPMMAADFRRVAGEPKPYDEDSHITGAELLGIENDEANQLFYTDGNARAAQRLHNMIDEAQAAEVTANNKGGVQK